MPIWVPRTRTVATPDEMKAALIVGYATEYGRQPSQNALAFMMAQTALETGNWQSMYGFNVGNITANENTYQGKAYRPAWYDVPPGGFTSERLAFLHEEMLQGRAPKAFRAYDNLGLGASDYVHRLRLDFPEIPTAMETGDAVQVAAAISKRYCPNCFHERETANLASLARQYGLTTPQQLPLVPPPGIPSGPDFGGVIALGFVLGAGYLFWKVWA